MKRIIAMATGVLVAAVLGLAVPATPSWAVPPPTPDIQVAPNGNDLGYISVGQDRTVQWWVTNFGDYAVTVATQGGSVGCVQNVYYPYVSPTSLTLNAGQTKYMYTYVRGSCVGLGTVYGTAGSTTATQYIHVV